ncbi:MAG TPA: thiamine pyrophosphate-dependent enzyme, partial [Ktedonobacterales bacterium]|nr:thiamine pyrophosphate-dependent enzyme [Ktedonobacterales bacterium]
MTTWDDFYGPNAGYAVELYERYQRDPRSVDEATRTFFERVAPPNGAAVDGTSARPAAQEPSARPLETDQVAKIVGAARLARGIREYGHLAAQIDPLGTPVPGDPMLDAATHRLSDADLAALPASIVFPEAGAEEGSSRDAIARLRAIYSGPLGYDFDHVQDFEERAWLKDQVECGAFRTPLAPEERAGLLRRLTQVAVFERFLNSTFQGQKRFSIEGNDALVPMLDALIHDAAQAGAREVLIGMAHRGRLNVLAHVLGKPYTAIFSEFHGAPNKDLVPSEGSMGINFGWTGDVKYHLGAQRVVREGEPIKVTMAHNPSHLEFVNPVIEGATRAAQDQRAAAGAPRQEPNRALAVVIHGDAAFPGEGVV